MDLDISALSDYRISIYFYDAVANFSIGTFGVFCVQSSLFQVQHLSETLQNIASLQTNAGYAWAIEDSNTKISESWTIRMCVWVFHIK